MDRKNDRTKERMDVMKLPFAMDLTSKVAVVTGGGGVLGSAFAKAIAQCGAKEGDKRDVPFCHIPDKVRM